MSGCKRSSQALLGILRRCAPQNDRRNSVILNAVKNPEPQVTQRSGLHKGFSGSAYYLRTLIVRMQPQQSRTAWDSFVVALLRMTNAVPVCTGMTSHRRSREDGSPSAATPGFLPSHQVRGRLRRNDVWGAFVRAWPTNTAGAVREPPLHYVNPLACGPVSRLDRLCRRACTTTPLDDEHRRTYACHHQQEHEEQPHREPAALVRRRRRRGLWP